MTLTGKQTFVGFGFGAIQAGLFLYEARNSGAFGRLVVADVLPQVVAAVRAAGGLYSLNIAHAIGVEKCQVGPIEIADPAVPADHQLLVEAVAAAHEIGTAVPSVRNYVSSGPGSIHRILAQGLRRKAARGGPAAVVYAAENHNHAAEILEAAVLGEIPEEERPAVGRCVRFLNTVIGKMSGIVTDPDEVLRRSLATATPGGGAAYLVEEFNHILISKIAFAAGTPPFSRGLAVFVEKDDLLPFEEAKLYGHNATHALAAYVARVRGVGRIAELRDVPDIMAFLRTAFIEESGAALIRRYHGIDALFTEAGYREYADDLLSRMTNTYLGDTVDRVGRDPQRKLSWDDRLIGTIRVALSQGIQPRRYALGAAAALAALDPAPLRGEMPAASVFESLWHDAKVDEKEKAAVLAAVAEGCRSLQDWCDHGFPDLEGMIRGTQRHS